MEQETITEWSESSGKGDSRGDCLPNPLRFELNSHQESDSVTKDNRGDKTPLELFLAGVRGWEAGLRRLFPEKSDGHSQT